MTATAPAFALPPPAAELPAPLPPPAQTGTALVVCRPNPSEAAAKMLATNDVFGQPLQRLMRTQRKAPVFTDYSLAPVFIGAGLAAGSWLFFDAAMAAMALSGIGTLATAVGCALHKSLKRTAIAKAPALLEGPLREQLLALDDVRRDFAPGANGAAVEAPEIDVFIAHRAAKMLKEHKFTDDPELLGIMQRWADKSATLTLEEQQSLDFIEKLIAPTGYHYSVGDTVKKLFDELPEERKTGLEPFVRSYVFNEDGAKHDRNSEAMTKFFHELEVIHPRLSVPFPTKPAQVPAPTWDSGDKIVSLKALATFLEKANLNQLASQANHNGSFPVDAIKGAVEFAIADERCGVERVLIARMIERAVKIMDERHVAAFRGRVAFADLMQTAADEPKAVRDRADEIMSNIDQVAENFHDDSRRRDDLVTASTLKKLIALLSLAPINR